MAFMNDTHALRGTNPGLMNRMRTEFSRVRENAAKRRLFRETLNELQGLTPRELDDMGIAPGQLRDVAWTATYGK